MVVYVYIVETDKNTLYTGITNDIERRMREHKSGRGARYIKMYGFKQLLATKSFQNRSKAMQEEYRIKQLSHGEKRELAKKWSK